MSRMPWWLRDLIYLTLFVAVLIAVSYGLDALADRYRAVAYYNRVIMLIGIAITLAVSLNIINGHCGQFSLGHAGFMAVGAYMSAYLTYNYFAKIVEKYPEGSTNGWLVKNALLLVAVIAGGLLSAIAGYLVGLPSLRLRGDYLAIVTLGFGEIIRVIILNVDAVGGARGLSGIPPWSNFFWIYFFAGLTILISVRLVSSSVGRAFLSIREDEIAANAMGVDTTRYKVKAFVLGSFLAGVAGALFAHYLIYLNPQTFTFIKSFEVVVMVVLGGLGSISGSIISATILTILPEALRAVNQYRMVMYALMLIVLMRTRPQGILGRRELWDFLPRRKDTTRDEKKEPGPPVT